VCHKVCAIFIFMGISRLFSSLAATRLQLLVLRRASVLARSKCSDPPNGLPSARCRSQHGIVKLGRSKCS